MPGGCTCQLPLGRPDQLPASRSRESCPAYRGGWAGLGRTDCSVLRKNAGAHWILTVLAEVNARLAWAREEHREAVAAERIRPEYLAVGFITGPMKAASRFRFTASGWRDSDTEHGQ